MTLLVSQICISFADFLHFRSYLAAQSETRHALSELVQAKQVSTPAQHGLSSGHNIPRILNHFKLAASDKKQHPTFGNRSNDIVCLFTFML